ncbi:MAG: ABC transporter ATP-binding protein/permease, partial [Stellaceae bacterium]
HIPAYLAWAALIYAGLGTWLTVKIGRPLVPLNFAQQRFEADFRYSLVRLRENAESVALYGGEPPEREIFDERFGGLFDNFWRIMLRQKKLNWFTSGYSQVAAVFPVLVVSPRYFAKQIQMGGLFQVVDAFSNVQSSLSFIINSFTDIATWVAVTERLTTFEQRMDEIEAGLRASQPIRLEREGTGIDIRDLDLDLPDGSPLARGISLRVEPGSSLLITGPSGTGKSTLLRAAAGIWPYGRGDVRLGVGRTFFMPQRPYFPLGTLKLALAYPALDSGVDDARMTEALERVGLGTLAAHLADDQNWPLRLSLGEQQRVAFARVLLARPDLIFLDEASSAVDEDDEARLYRMLRSHLPDAAIVSVGHRESLKALHDRVLDLTRFHAAAPVTD